MVDKHDMLLYMNGVCYQRAVKNRHRTIRDNAPDPDAAQVLIDSDKSKMLSDPDQWRAAVAGVLPCAIVAESRSSQKMLKAEAQSYAVTSKVEDTLMLKENLIMKWKHYKRHYKKWEANDSDAVIEDATQKFRKLHGEQSGEHDSSDGAEYVRFKNPKAREQ